MGIKKTKLRLERLEEVKKRASDLGIDIQIYANGSHMRLFGDVVMDYWPGTGRAWRTGTNSKAEFLDLDKLFLIATGREFIREHQLSLGILP